MLAVHWTLGGQCPCGVSHPGPSERPEAQRGAHWPNIAQQLWVREGSHPPPNRGKCHTGPLGHSVPAFVGRTPSSLGLSSYCSRKSLSRGQELLAALTSLTGPTAQTAHEQKEKEVCSVDLGLAGSLPSLLYDTGKGSAPHLPIRQDTFFLESLLAPSPIVMCVMC